jgi:photosynthetic reaction center H subunit
MRQYKRNDRIRRRPDDLSDEQEELSLGGPTGRGPHDMYQGSDAAQPYQTSRLVHLDDVSEFKVADGDPDIRGWDVRTADGRKIGTVEDLIVDTGLMKVRYIEARLDTAVTRTSDERHVLIPIGTARLDDDEDDVYLATNIVNPEQLPAYDHQPLTRDFEVSLRGQFGGGNADMVGKEVDDEFYRHDLYDDARFFGSRRSGREDANYISPADDHNSHDHF